MCKFHVRRGILLLARRFRKAIDGKTTARDGVLQTNAVLVGAAAVGFDGRGSRERRRAQKTPAKASAFFVGPIHKAHSDRRPSVEFLRETPQHFETGRDAQRSVQPSTVRNGIQMATDDQGLLRRAWQRGPAIARGIVVMLDREAGDLGLKPLARFEPGVGPRDTLRAVVVRGESAQLLQVRDGSFGIETHDALLTRAL